jgi:hypothetical protein
MKEGVMKRSTIHAALAVALPGVLLSGCYVMPIGSDQMDKLLRAMEQAQAGSYAPKPAASAAQGASASASPSPAAAPAPVPKGPVSLPARLYPVNDIATEAGMVSGTVTSMGNGKGRIQFTYRGENLVGEATRVSGDERKGIATAWGPTGAFMTCEYQMSTLALGAGTCNFSDGARYQVHVGN